MQLLVESLVLALCGGLAGLLLAAATMPVLAALMEASGEVSDIRLHWQALAVSTAVLSVATMVFGVVSSVVTLRRDPGRVLTAAARSGDPDLGRWRSVLVVGQVALALPVICLASAIGASLLQLEHAAGAYEPGRVLQVWPTGSSLGEARYPSIDRVDQLLRDVEGAIGAVPGVAGVASTLPMLTWRSRPTNVHLAGHPGGAWTTQLRLASPGLFATMNLPVLEGRALVDADETGRRRVAVVTRRLVSAYLPGSSPIGRLLQVTGPVPALGSVGSEPFEIVGVVGDIPLPMDYEDAVGIVPVMFVPRAMAPIRWSQILVRTALPAGAVERDIRKAIARVDPGMVVETSTLQTYIDRWWTSWPRLIATIATAFATIAVVLVLVGVFGALSYTVAQRRREIGVRMALGASSAQMTRAIVWRGLQWTLMGILLGALAASAALTLARSQVWGVAALDVPLLGSVAAFVLLAAGLAAWLPARRAGRVDPVTVLRAE